jgi:hypothetical protein
LQTSAATVSEDAKQSFDETLNDETKDFPPAINETGNFTVMLKLAKRRKYLCETLLSDMIQIKTIGSL